MKVTGYLLVRRFARRVIKKTSAFPKRQSTELSFLKKTPNTPTEKISSGKREIVIQAKNVEAHHGANLRTFDSFNLRSDVLNGVHSLNIAQPTMIQMSAIPLVMENRNIFCAAQTGSGKTLVYVTTIVHNLRNEVDEGFIARLGRPRALVVAPTRELATQILKLFKSFSHHAPFRSVGLIGQHQKKWTRDYVKGEIDVVVGTPSTILKYKKRGLLRFSDLRYLVLDEADTLMDESFRCVIRDILDMVDFTSNDGHTVQCILTAATLPPKGIIARYEEYIDDLQVCQSNLHKLLPQVKYSFLKTRQDQKSALLKERLMKFLKRDSRKCMIFCNTSKSSNYTSMLLNQDNIPHSKMHGNVNPKVRLQDYHNFFNGTTRIMVCTDIASRGLDTNNVTLVVNFDCPYNTIDFLHRAGRTGRANHVYSNEAEVVTYITQNKEAFFAAKIQDAASKSKALDDIRSKQKSSKQRYEEGMRKFGQAGQT